MKLITAFFFLIISSLASANSNSFKCTVLDAASVSSEGKLDMTNGFVNIYKDKKTEFVVDRGTGRRLSKLISNHNLYGSPEILDRGSKSQSFKVLTIYKPFVQVDYLYIKSWVDSPEKPFYFLSMDGLVTGTCVDY